MALLFIGNRGALYYKDKMSEKKFWYKIEDSLYDEKEELGEDLRRIRSHVHNEIEEAPGKVIAFPAYCNHCVTPVEKGNRYSLVVWIFGPEWK